MPARKNRPGKAGATPKTGGSHQDRLQAIKISGLILSLAEQEFRRPGEAHYVGWPQMKDAHFLEKHGYLTESGTVLGCFHLQPSFKELISG